MITLISVIGLFDSFNSEDTLTFSIPQTNTTPFNNDIGGYVAELQLHMALQARNLVPTFNHPNESRSQLLRDSQATLEKLASRRTYS